MWRTVTVFVVAIVVNASGIGMIGPTAVATRIAGRNSGNCLGFGWGTGIGACVSHMVDTLHLARLPLLVFSFHILPVVPFYKAANLSIRRWLIERQQSSTTSSRNAIGRSIDGITRSTAIITAVTTTSGKFCGG